MIVITTRFEHMYIHIVDKSFMKQACDTPLKKKRDTSLTGSKGAKTIHQIQKWRAMQNKKIQTDKRRVVE